MSGSGKTTLILESLVPGLEAVIAGKKLPEHVKAVEAEGIELSLIHILFVLSLFILGTNLLVKGILGYMIKRKEKKEK